MITARDMDVINFLDDFKVARTSTIASLFYPSLRVAQKRLETLADYEEVNRARDNINSEYVYYLKKPKQLRHSLILTDFYRELAKSVTIIGFRSEVTIEHLRADGLVGFVKNGKSHAAFIEVQLANTPLDIGKYEKLYHSGAYKRYFESFPLIFAVTNKQTPKTFLRVIPIRIEQIIKQKLNLEKLL